MYDDPTQHQMLEREPDPNGIKNMADVDRIFRTMNFCQNCNRELQKKRVDNTEKTGVIWLEEFCPWCYEYSLN